MVSSLLSILRQDPTREDFGHVRRHAQARVGFARILGRASRTVTRWPEDAREYAHASPPIPDEVGEMGINEAEKVWGNRGHLHR
jgi:hypothetical protein